MTDQPKPRERTHVAVVTGLSGAGKSTALNALEDLGYFCVDNLPTSLVVETVEVCERGNIARIALGIDVRVGSFLDGAVDALARLGGSRELAVLFLDAADEALLRRYSETRRPHPLTAAQHGVAPERGAIAVLDGVQLERERLAPLRARATVVIDTTSISVHDLRRQVIAHLGPGKAEQPRMLTRVMSFGFKYGPPVDADVIFDVRMLPNPFFVPHLRHLPGTNDAVRKYVLEAEEAGELLTRLTDLYAYALPRYEREGKSYLTIGIGCTGGRHRSVAMSVALAERLHDKTALPITVVHRDVWRGDEHGSFRPPPIPGGGT
jgi:UPF0042 nucleotide-binding protein